VKLPLATHPSGHIDVLVAAIGCTPITAAR